MPTVCSLPSDPGPCKAYFPRWAFNKIAGQCEQFVYGGCYGNGNRFESRTECERTCVEPTTPAPIGRWYCTVKILIYPNKRAWPNNKAMMGPFT